MDCFILKNEEKRNKRSPLVMSSGSHSESLWKWTLLILSLRVIICLFHPNGREPELCDKGRENLASSSFPYSLRGTCRPVWSSPPSCYTGCEWNLLCVEWGNLFRIPQPSMLERSGRMTQCTSISLEVWGGRVGGRTEDQSKEVTQPTWSVTFQQTNLGSKCDRLIHVLTN